MNINARSAGPPSCFLLASRSPVSCNSEKARFSDLPHAPASRRPRCRCRSRWPRASVPQLRSSRTLWPGLSWRRAKGLERRADKPPLKTSGAWPRCSRPAVWMMRHHPQHSRAAPSVAASTATGSSTVAATVIAAPSVAASSASRCWSRFWRAADRAERSSRLRASRFRLRASRLRAASSSFDRGMIESRCPQGCCNTRCV